ncbi:SMODS domain-containing nucleotidyltransferase [Arthrobacter bambusae]|uniref:SMODS domain-containing nucleotidyltransferase n=1 Tax=Arthrobacter bambusae TaxID=1338426 RepID=UPI00277FA964|nr:hypothetical protein [Arthrobacter bambusae]MDQ0212896.1 hypothetical protein [Arthrobacter bambusae]MDQ0237202.1 hypothetical protein [Arthrobacter bambusae]
MAKTVDEAFSIFIDRLIPSATERSKAASHRQAIYDKLDNRFGLYRMFESGSFKHGTGISGKSDVDYFVSLKTTRPTYASSTLTAVRDALKERFPSTYIHTSRPAVVLEFGQGYERVEIIPAYADLSTDDGMRFDIAGVATEWMESTPEAHLKYVNACNDKAGVKGGAKQLARLAKAWKYYRNVPISSFYLEMRAAQHMATQFSVIYPLDFCYFLNSLNRHLLADMNDPTGNTGRIKACSSEANYIDARSKLATAVARANKAVELSKAGRASEAFAQWDLVFDGRFPAYY